MTEVFDSSVNSYDCCGATEAFRAASETLLRHSIDCALCDSDGVTLEQLEVMEEAVRDFIERSGITNPSQITAVAALAAAALSHGWWNKCDLIYPFVGGTAGAHAQNLKSSSFTITWNGTVTHDANGITGNGTTGFGDTGYMPSSSGQMGINSCHLASYQRTRGTGNFGHYLSSVSLGPFQTRFRVNIPERLRCGLNNTAGEFSAIYATTPLKFVACSRLTAANVLIFALDSQASGAQISTGMSARPLYVLANNNAGVAQELSDSNMAGATAGSGITFAEYQVMAADWQAFQTALGRQV